MLTIPKLKSIPLIGMRTLKTGLAVVATLYLAKTGWISNPMYAVIGTILAMQPTLRDSLVAGKERLLGTILGGLVGYGFALLSPDSILLIGISVLITIYCCNLFKLNNAVSIALTVSISILIGLDNQDALTYSIWRTWDTSLGVLMGAFINFTVAQPNYLKSVLQQLTHLLALSQDYAQKSDQLTVEELKEFRRELNQLDQWFDYLEKDATLKQHPQLVTQGRIPVEWCHDLYFHLKNIVWLKEDHISPDHYQMMLDYHRQELKTKQDALQDVTHYFK